MPKDVAIVEGGPLMDPAGKDFQAMLSAAQTAAVDKLAVKVDTSMVEDEKDGKGDKPKVSSTESKTTPKVEAKAEKEESIVPEDEAEGEPGDDIGNLKHKVSGLQAELARVRKQKTGSAEEAQSLKERIADMEGQLKVLREGKTATTIEDRLKGLTEDQVAENKVSWDDELVDARVTAKQAERDRDPDALAQANQRIVDARRMIKLYVGEEKRRERESQAKGASAQATEKETATELETFFGDLYKAAPDLKDQESDLWKAGQAEYDKLPKVMKSLGALGELVAAAYAIAKNPHLIGKKVISAETGKVLDSIEKAVDKSFQKGGAAPSGSKFTPVTTINSQADLLSFEEQVRKVKGG